MKTVAHIYASKAKMNSGDFMIGIATKKYFEEHIMRNEKKDTFKFISLDCRQHYNDTLINKLNTFDYIIVGAGGLILPDSSPNNTSCWQWIIHEDKYKNNETYICYKYWL